MICTIYKEVSLTKNFIAFALSFYYLTLAHPKLSFVDETAL